jgi:hypothetical protein
MSNIHARARRPILKYRIVHERASSQEQPPACITEAQSLPAPNMLNYMSPPHSFRREDNGGPRAESNDPFQLMVTILIWFGTI